MSDAHARAAAHSSIQTFLELTQVPTAAGKEQAVIAWIQRWAARRPHIKLTADLAGNLLLSHVDAAPFDLGVSPQAPPLFITAHLDHPAFVVERIVSPDTVELSFRGGVMDVFFDHAPIRIHPGFDAADRAGASIAARLSAVSPSSSPAGKHYLADLHPDASHTVSVGDIATWDLPAASLEGDELHTAACDDLAAAAAALCAFDRIHPAATTPEPAGAGTAIGSRPPSVHLLFTRAEEIGFIGAIAACKLGTMPRGSRVIALENSRAFPDSPIGAGPIVRVGDRLSIFTPWLTNACAKRAEQLFGPAQPTAAQTSADLSRSRKWQRKLMAGGACEASVFCAYGYDATCLCLPLGNYHNMPHLTELQAGAYDREQFGVPRAAREFVHQDDYLGLIDLLIGLAQELPAVDPILQRVEKLYADKAYVLD
ncbi:MAG: hypothetical protein AB7G11_15560 [Phycisphaerales bacterium]